MTLGEMCEHGQLKRQCLTCEWEGRYNELDAQLTDAKEHIREAESQIKADAARIKHAEQRVSNQKGNQMEHLDKDMFVAWVGLYSFISDQRMLEMMESLRACWVEDEQVGDRLAELLDKLSVACCGESDPDPDDYTQPPPNGTFVVKAKCACENPTPAPVASDEVLKNMYWSSGVCFEDTVRAIYNLGCADAAKPAPKEDILRWAHIWYTPNGEFIHIYSSRPADLPGAKICRVRIVEVVDA